MCPASRSVMTIAGERPVQPGIHTACGAGQAISMAEEGKKRQRSAKNDTRCHPASFKCGFTAICHRPEASARGALSRFACDDNPSPRESEALALRLAEPVPV